MMNDVTSCYQCQKPIHDWENRVANFSNHSYFLIPKYSECHPSCYLQLCLDDSIKCDSHYITCKKCDKLIVKMMSQKHEDAYYHSGCYANHKRIEFLNDPKNKER